MLIVSSAILLIAIIYLLVGIYTQNELRAEQQAELDAAKNACDDAEHVFMEVSRPIFNKIAEVYGKEYAAEIEEGALRPGMPEEFLLLTLGDPEEIYSSYVRGTKREEWYYDAVQASDEKRYTTKIVIVNNKIAEIAQEE